VLREAETYIEKKQIVEEHRDLLLSEVTDEFFVDALTVYRDREPIATFLDRYHALMRSCRNNGIEEGFIIFLINCLQLPYAPGAQSSLDRLLMLEAAMELVSRNTQPIAWAYFQSQAGRLFLETLGMFGSHFGADAARHSEQAVRYFRRALEVFTPQEYPEKYSEIQAGLAGALLSYQPGDRAENAEEAIRCLQRALEVATAVSPEKYSDIHMFLALAHLERQRGDRAENVEEAILYLQRALEATTEASTDRWAMLQKGLGFAYSERGRGDRAENVEEAILYLQRALEATTEASTDRWKSMHPGEESEFEVDLFPVAKAEWAHTQYLLGGAFLDRQRGDRAENAEKAILYLQRALGASSVYTYPYGWAQIQMLLGLAFVTRDRGDQTENAEETIRCYRRALEVFTPQAHPERCGVAATSLANILYGERRFSEARVAYVTAHEAVEMQRNDTLREGTQRGLSQETAGLYAHLVHCCLIEGDEEAAFKYAVAGKGQAFVNLLATARFDLSAAGADDPKLAEHLRQARELRQQIDNLLAKLSGEGGPFTAPHRVAERRSQGKMHAELRALQDREIALWEDMTYEYPALSATQRAPTVTADDARGLTRKLNATLVEYYSHAGGWCAFVVTPDSVQHVPLPAVNDEVLGRMLKWSVRIESPTGRGRLSYESLHRLHETSIAPLRDYVPSDGQVVLAPFADLHLLPLAAALDPVTGRYAAEDYTLAFAPSLSALRVLLERESRRDSKEKVGGISSGWLAKLRRAFARDAGAYSTGRQTAESLLSVAYPGAPDSGRYLPNVLPEAEAVARHFDRVTPLHGNLATPEAVLSHARGQDVVHLGCHGWFDPDAPEQSGLMLSGGWLTVQRVITELRLDRTRLTTLSACVSGLMRIGRGEEHVGLLQGVMSAGARSVVASLWPVNDASTRALFEVFYAELRAGSSPAEALADAARLVRSRPGWEHPYYWAAFQANGLAHSKEEPGPVTRHPDTPERIEEMHHESMQTRGGSSVGGTDIVKGSLDLLEQMTENPDEVRAALDPEERKRVVAELHDLESRAAGVQTNKDLLTLADAVHQLVESTPALADLLLPEEVDAATEQEKRWFYIEDPKPSCEALHIQENTTLILNEVHELRWNLEESARERDTSPESDS
jgi:CHAT domain-containing protein/tetratricopeptide (TPR) repeat protein